MTLVWVSTASHDVREVIEHAAHKLAAAQDPYAEPVTALDPLMELDPYLAEQVQVMHHEWSVNPWRITPPSSSVVGQLFGTGQHIIRKLTWWYNLPQWQQISTFHGATVRTTDTLIAHLLAIKAQINQIASAHADQRLHDLEQQMRAAQQRLDALEQQNRTTS